MTSGRVSKESFAEARLGLPPDEVNRSEILAPLLAEEQRLLPVFLQVDMAHTVMLTEQGILTAEQGRALLLALKDLADPGTSFEVDLTLDTLLLQVEHQLARAAGEDVAGRLHTGRSRNDQSSTVDRLFTRDQLIGLAADVLELQRTLLELAAGNREQLMPGYTHLQPAQPITFAHYLMRHAAAFERDQQRLEGTFGRVNLSALGIAAMAGTSWPLDRERTALLLGHEGIVRNGMDCGVFNQDYQGEVAAVISIIANSLARLATDLYVWSTAEFALVEIADSLAGTSSIMPQKKNPHALERIMSTGGISIGWLPAILGATRGPSSSDLMLTFAFRPLRPMLEATRGSVRLMTATLSSLQLNRATMRERAGIGWNTASNLADELVRQTGIPFRTAHQVVGRLVRDTIQQDLEPGDVTEADVERVIGEVTGSSHRLPAGFVHRALDPDEFVRSRVTVGGPRPDDVAEHIAQVDRAQSLHRSWHRAKVEMIEAASQQLRERVEALSQP